MISVKVITHGRPGALLRLLESLAHQKAIAPDALEYEIEVIDNSSARPLTSLETETLRKYRANYYYLGADNIARARNVALDRCGGESAAFIDDDEVASPLWLAHLQRALNTSGSDAVFGPVIPRYPAGARHWIISSRILTRPFIPATNNCLMKIGPLRQARLKFDERFGFCGGEDSDFFHRMQRLQFHFAWCEEATVEESFDGQRLRTSWLARRAFRCGGARGAVLSKTTLSVYAQELIGAVSAYRWVKQVRRGKTKAEAFGEFFWRVFYSLGFVWFALSGKVWAEYSGDGRSFISFPRARWSLPAIVWRRLFYPPVSP